MTRSELIAEAVAIADGQTMKMGTTAHVRALVEMAREQGVTLPGDDGPVCSDDRAWMGKERTDREEWEA